MEKKHDIFNMTIVQVLIQQLKRVIGLESDIKGKEQLIEKAEVDLKVAKQALKNEEKKESLEEKERAIDFFNNI